MLGWAMSDATWIMHLCIQLNLEATGYVIAGAIR